MPPEGIIILVGFGQIVFADRHHEKIAQHAHNPP